MYHVHTRVVSVLKGLFMEFGLRTLGFKLILLLAMENEGRKI